MFSKKYDIERFWCPTDGIIELDYWGFLQDPHTYTEWMGQPDSVPFERIADVPVLVLLGEPGTGKSQWFQDAQNKTVEEIQLQGNRSLWIDLGLYDSASDAVNAVFGDTEFALWAHGEHRLHLFIDSFDECHFRVNVLPKQLLKELRRQPIERLCLRILCRTSEWPQSLEDGLRDLWAEHSPMPASLTEGEAPKEALIKEASSKFVQVFEMTPFRKEDVVQIIQGEGIEPEAFLNEIRSRELVAFANRPQPLDFLVKMHKATGRFPTNQVDLYRQGCRELCREPSRDRTDTRTTGNFEIDELFAVAGRLAALTVFCNKHSILRYDVAPNEVSEAEISFRDISHRSERVGGREVAVGRDIIRETLNTGLFSGRPGGRMGWAHQTYAEFLAAEYLCNAGLPVNQIMSLIQHPHWSEKKIPPQLSETAAWLSLMKEDFLDLLMEVDPEVLLLKRQHGDSGPQQDNQRARLVGSLLKLLDEERLLDHRISFMPRLGDLQHPRLGDQLRRYITNRTKNFVVRRVAIQIAEENEVRGLEDAISEVALDPEDDYLVRQPAARALIQIASDDVKLNLRPLALGKVGDDPEDELRGCALMALWPDHLTAAELFDNLTAPKNPSFFGSYDQFLSQILIDRMHASHLPAALDWVQRQANNHNQRFSFEKIINSIMLFAYGNFEYPAIFEQFVKAALRRLREYQEIIPSGPGGREDSILFVDQDKRRRLVTRIIQLGSESTEEASFVAHRISGLLSRNDVPWLLGLFAREPKQPVRDIVAWLIGSLFAYVDQQQFETIYSLAQQSTTLTQVLKPFIEPVILDSEDAKRMRRQFRAKQQSDRADDRERVRSECPQDVILKYLDKSETENSGQFAPLAWHMIKPERAVGPLGSLPTDLTELRSWRAAEEDTRQRIIRVAIRYLTDCDPETCKWVRTAEIYWSAWAGYIALVLLLRADSHSFARILNNVWAKWVPAIAVCSSVDESAESRRLLIEAYRRVPNAFISHVINQIDYNNRRSKHVSILDRLEECWDERLSQTIHEKLNDPSLTPEIVTSLLEALSRHDPDRVVGFALSKLEVPLPGRGRGRILALVGARVLMLNFPEIGWPIVWPAIASARLFGRQLMHLLASEAYFGLKRAFQQLPEDALATLYIRISREYPIPEEEMSRRVLRSPREHDIGERILRHLQDRGTIESVRALQTLCTRLPERAERLRWVLEAAKDRTLAETWTPWRPEEVLGLVQDHQKRLVQSGDQLLQVVIESINRLQQSLHDELPAVRDLWDRQAKRLQGRSKDQEKVSWIPVDERPLTDRIARHLREDLTDRGIVIGREVQIRPGEFTDIHVDALTQVAFPNRMDVIRVMIEVKGCWNDGVQVDMERQLLERYMAKNQCQHGLYLVGWFYCKSWDEDDYRSRKPCKEIVEMPIEHAQQMFEAQAKALTAKCGKVVRAVVLDARRRG